MPNERREDLDRRDFMMAAIGLVGTSASLASSASTAHAQDTKVPPVGLEPGALQRTNGLYRRCNPGEEGHQRS